MCKRIGWLLAILLMLASTARAQTSCQTNYTAACYGATVCFTATATSLQIIPQNTQRKYLLIQNQSSSSSVYYAICNTSSAQTCVAVVNTNTVQLGGCGWYEVSALDSGSGSSGSRVPSGAVAIISTGPSISVCIMENNG